jgi:hypothetical protein
MLGITILTQKTLLKYLIKALFSNVTMGNSLDDEGRERFHPLGLKLDFLLSMSNKFYSIMLRLCFSFSWKYTRLAY